jgi:hypothetical protein
MTPEGRVKAKAKELLKTIGAYAYWPVPMGYGASSVDVFVCYKGQFYAVEFKRPEKKTATRAQSNVLREVAEAGGGTCVENSPDLATMKRMFGLC